VIHPIKEIGALLRGKSSCLFIVDAITVLGASPVKMDEWALDVVVGGAQKGLMLPPGLALIALSEKAWEFNAQAKCPRFYFDLRAELIANQKGETRFSSAVSHIRALPIALKQLLKDGLDARYAYVEKLASAARKGGERLGLGLFPAAPSPTLTALSLPEGVDGQKLRRHLEEKYSITVMGGQDQLKGKILRIGHLGYILPNDILDFVEALGFSLQEFGQDVTDEQIQAALECVNVELDMKK
jgi:aspartate aminotransferase-like enzyme